MSNDLLYHFVGVANQQRAVRASLSVETRTRDGRPSALLPDIGDGAGVAGKEVIGGVLRRRGHVTQGVYADLQSIECVPRSPASLPVEIDQWPEAPSFTADDGDHQGKPKRAGTSERLWGPTNAQIGKGFCTGLG